MNHNKKEKAHVPIYNGSAKELRNKIVKDYYKSKSYDEPWIWTQDVLQNNHLPISDLVQHQKQTARSSQDIAKETAKEIRDRVLKKFYEDQGLERPSIYYKLDHPPSMRIINNQSNKVKKEVAKQEFTKTHKNEQAEVNISKNPSSRAKGLLLSEQIHVRNYLSDRISLALEKPGLSPTERAAFFLNDIKTDIRRATTIDNVKKVFSSELTRTVKVFVGSAALIPTVCGIAAVLFLMYKNPGLLTLQSTSILVARFGRVTVDFAVSLFTDIAPLLKANALGAGLLTAEVLIRYFAKNAIQNGLSNTKYSWVTSRFAQSPHVRAIGAGVEHFVLVCSGILRTLLVYGFSASGIVNYGFSRTLPYIFQSMEWTGSKILSAALSGAKVSRKYLRLLVESAFLFTENCLTAGQETLDLTNTDQDGKVGGQREGPRTTVLPLSIDELTLILKEKTLLQIESDLSLENKEENVGKSGKIVRRVCENAEKAFAEEFEKKASISSKASAHSQPSIVQVFPLKKASNQKFPVTKPTAIARSAERIQEMQKTTNEITQSKLIENALGAITFAGLIAVFSLYGPDAFGTVEITVEQLKAIWPIEFYPVIPIMIEKIFKHGASTLSGFVGINMLVYQTLSPLLDIRGRLEDILPDLSASKIEALRKLDKHIKNIGPAMLSRLDNDLLRSFTATLLSGSSTPITHYSREQIRTLSAAQCEKMIRDFGQKGVKLLGLYPSAGQRRTILRKLQKEREEQFASNLLKSCLATTITQVAGRGVLNGTEAVAGMLHKSVSSVYDVMARHIISSSYLSAKVGLSDDEINSLKEYFEKRDATQPTASKTFDKHDTAAFQSGIGKINFFSALTTASGGMVRNILSSFAPGEAITIENIKHRLSKGEGSLSDGLGFAPRAEVNDRIGREIGGNTLEALIQELAVQEEPVIDRQANVRHNQQLRDFAAQNRIARDEAEKTYERQAELNRVKLGLQLAKADLDKNRQIDTSKPFESIWNRAFPEDPYNTITESHPLRRLYDIETYNGKKYNLMDPTWDLATPELKQQAQTTLQNAKVEANEQLANDVKIGIIELFSENIALYDLLFTKDKAHLGEGRVVSIIEDLQNKGKALDGLFLPLAFRSTEYMATTLTDGIMQMAWFLGPLIASVDTGISAYNLGLDGEAILKTVGAVKLVIDSVNIDSKMDSSLAEIHQQVSDKMKEAVLLREAKYSTIGEVLADSRLMATVAHSTLNNFVGFGSYLQDKLSSKSPFSVTSAEILPDIISYSTTAAEFLKEILDADKGMVQGAKAYFERSYGIVLKDEFTKIAAREIIASGSNTVAPDSLVRITTEMIKRMTIGK